MIKNILYICLLALLAISCEKKESFLYEETDGLYFALPGAAEKPWTSEEPDKFDEKIDFAFRKTGQKDGNWMYDLYYGDSLRTDTMRLLVAVAGKTSEQAREYSLKTLPLADSIETAEIQFFNPYRIEAGQMQDTAIIVINRPAKRGEFGVKVTFDITNSPDFGSSIYGWNNHNLTVVDRYPEPNRWDENQYGEYSEEKYAFWVTVLQTTYENRWNMFDQNWMPIDIVKVLNDALREYNTTHPDNKKDFTFPGYVE